MRSAIVMIVLATHALLLVPLMAMQFTDEVDWGLGDFVVAGTLLFGAALAYVLVARWGETVTHRVAAGAVIGAIHVVVCAGLAV